MISHHFIQRKSITKGQQHFPLFLMSFDVFVSMFIMFHLRSNVVVEALLQRDTATECGGLVPQRELNDSNVTVHWMVFRCHHSLLAFQELIYVCMYVCMYVSM